MAEAWIDHSENELQRLHSGPAPGEQARGFVIDVLARCSGDPEPVLARVRDVLAVVLRHRDREPEDEFWRTALPPWFVDAPADAPDAWHFESWIDAFDDNSRPWWWWDARVTDERDLLVSVIVDGHPAPLASLGWLLTVAGAVEIIEDVA